MSLDRLKITECPFAFASFAEKHNALVDMLAAITGQNGITVVLAEKNGVIRGNMANGGGGTTLTNVANVVGFDGRLQNVYVGNTIANAWPAVGKYVTASGNVDISSTGVVITTTGGVFCNIAFASLTHNMNVRKITVCDNGSTKSMDIIASATY